jgi:bifunctional DNase/RNase
MREMTVYGVSFDIAGKQPIVLLKTADDNTFLPIWIGHPEAAAILMRLQGSEPDRPMTHDLLSSVISSLAAEVVSITVTELRENTYHARITLAQDGREIDIDSRTSDAIALALRTDAKIYADESVVDESGIEFDGDEPIEGAARMLPAPLADLDPAEFRKFLDTVTPDEFATDVTPEPEDVEEEDDTL